MGEWRVKNICEVLSCKIPEQLSEDFEFAGIFTDSRQVLAGGLFVPLVGERFNGHKFVEDALRQGAAGALWSEGQAGDIAVPTSGKLFFVEDVLQAYLLLSKVHMDRCKVKAVAVTGSVGKTTTKEFLRSILGSTYKVGATVANHNNEVGVAQTLLSLDESCDVVVTEMGMRARGEIARLAKIVEPDVSVITTIGESHLEILGSRHEIALAKAEILDYGSQDGLAVLPADSDFYAELCQHAKGRIASFGVNEGVKADWHLLSTRHKVAYEGKKIILGQEVIVATPEGEKSFFLPVPGKHNCANFLAALAACRYLGVTWEGVGAGLKEGFFTDQRLHMELIDHDNSILIDDSYNAAPRSVEAALDVIPMLISALEDRSLRRVAVLGDMLELGPNSDRMHREVGEYCAKCGIDLLLCVGQLSRHMQKGADACGLETIWVSDYREAEEILPKVYRPGDCLLIKASHSVQLDRLAEKIREEYV